MEREGRSAPPASLIEISRVIEEAARLVRLHAEHDGEAAPPPPPRAGAPRPVDDPQWIRAILELRALRHEFLGFEASDAALAMLLALYAARLEQRPLHQTALAVAARVPDTTALRIVRQHLDRGTFVSAPDATDRRLNLITLSDRAAAHLRAYLTAAAGSAPIVA